MAPPQRDDRAIASILPVRPYLDAKPWGGRGLSAFGFALPPDAAIGEAHLTSAEAVVAAGPQAGRTLGELAAVAPEALVGDRGLAATGGRPIFPLLIKLIEATSHLSIQVHPDDEAARRLAGDKLGKTEAWHVLAAEPGAELLLGLREDADPNGFADAVRRGERVARFMRAIPARVGETVLLPAGTVHALGGGTLIYEVQQPSDLTYRLDDWGRVGPDGKPRPLHVEPGLAVVNPALRPSPIRPVDLPATQGRRQLLVASRYFALERVALPVGGVVETVASDSPQVVTCIKGAARVRIADEELPLGVGGTVVVSSAAQVVRVVATVPAILLRAWVPAEPSGP